MAGYIMTLDSEESLRKCIRNGVYSTRLSETKNDNWSVAHEGTFADYYSMKDGDYIFFFIKRKIYGIGVLTNIDGDCKYLNYNNADIPKNYSTEEIRGLNPLVDDFNPVNRCLCIFKPYPFFFMRSVDMDEALNSAPSKFKSLRAMWKVSFIKLDDEESQALFDILLKRNESSLADGIETYEFDDTIHKQISNRLNENHRMLAYRILAKAASNGTSVKHEMAIEACLCAILGNNNKTPMGKWDYISHQVVASPFKPVDYMDKMDIFGYRYIDGYSTISKYLVAEIKKDSATPEVIEQIMKYVDWVNQEYAYGDYSMIEAYVIAHDFPEDVIKKRNEECVRNFVKGYRPAEAATWSNVKLIRYEFYDDGMDFIEVL